jgi:hypothetical protein
MELTSRGDYQSKALLKDPEDDMFVDISAAKIVADY